MRTRLPESRYVEIFRFVMRVLNERSLLRGQVAGMDATYLRAVTFSGAGMRATKRRAPRVSDLLRRRGSERGALEW